MIQQLSEDYVGPRLSLGCCGTDRNTNICLRDWCPCDRTFSSDCPRAKEPPQDWDSELVKDARGEVQDG